MEAGVSQKPTPVGQELPRGLRWRGGVLWISKKVNGKRYQVSTGCKTLDGGLEVFSEFLREHGLKDRAGSGRRIVTGWPKLPKGLYWKGPVIWLSRVVKGKHYNISTGTDNLKLAEQFLADFNLKAFKSEKLGVITRPKVTFEALATRYLDQGKLNGLRPKTIDRYSAVRDHFQAFLTLRGLAGADVQALTSALIEDYKAWRATTPLNRNGWPVKEGEQADASGASQKTLQFEVQTVGTFFKHGVRLKFLTENPTSDVRPVRLSKSIPVYLNEQEITKLLESAKSFDQWAGFRYAVVALLHDIIVTYLKTGMRLQELRTLEWSDVDLERNEISIRVEKEIRNCRLIPISKNAISVLRATTSEAFSALSISERRKLLGKWRMPASQIGALQHSNFDLNRGILNIATMVPWKPKSTHRIIPIAAGLRAVFQTQIRRDNLVFPDTVTGGLWRFSINKLLQRCVRHAGILKPLHTHSLRHTFATQLRQRGVALETIKELLGHADIRDTLIYAHFSPEEARAAIPRIDFF